MRFFFFIALLTRRRHTSSKTVATRRTRFKKKNDYFLFSSFNRTRAVFVSYRNIVRHERLVHRQRAAQLPHAVQESDRQQTPVFAEPSVSRDFFFFSIDIA